MKNLTLCILVCGCIFMLYACKRDCTPQHSEVNVDDEINNKVPYKNESKLYFVDSATHDTHIFQGQGWKTSYIEFSKRDVDLCGLIVKYEVLKQEFVSATFQHPLSICIQPYNENYYQYLDIESGPFLYSINFNNVLLPLANHQDSTKILDTWRYNVVSTNYSNTDKYDCLYNSQFGILKIINKDYTLSLLKAEDM